MHDLHRERRVLAGRVEQQRTQLDRLRAIVAGMEEKLAHDERMLDELDSLLGNPGQMRIEALNPGLRGRRLEEIAIVLLRERAGAEAEIHYREWFELVRSRGHRVAGKDPLATFLAQLNRSKAVARVGRRTGRYRLLPQSG